MPHVIRLHGIIAGGGKNLVIVAVPGVGGGGRQRGQGDKQRLTNDGCGIVEGDAINANGRNHLLLHLAGQAADHRAGGGARAVGIDINAGAHVRLRHGIGIPIAQDIARRAAPGEGGRRGCGGQRSLQGISHGGRGVADGDALQHDGGNRCGGNRRGSGGGCFAGGIAGAVRPGVQQVALIRGFHRVGGAAAHKHAVIPEPGDGGRRAGGREGCRQGLAHGGRGIADGHRLELIHAGHIAVLDRRPGGHSRAAGGAGACHGSADLSARVAILHGVAGPGAQRHALIVDPADLHAGRGGRHDGPEGIAGLHGGGADAHGGDDAGGAGGEELGHHIAGIGADADFAPGCAILQHGDLGAHAVGGDGRENLPRAQAHPHALAVLAGHIGGVGGAVVGFRVSRLLGGQVLRHHIAAQAIDADLAPGAAIAEHRHLLPHLIGCQHLMLLGRAGAQHHVLAIAVDDIGGIAARDAAGAGADPDEFIHHIPRAPIDADPGPGVAGAEDGQRRAHGIGRDDGILGRGAGAQANRLAVGAGHGGGGVFIQLTAGDGAGDGQVRSAHIAGLAIGREDVVPGAGTAQNGHRGAGEIGGDRLCAGGRAFPQAEPAALDGGGRIFIRPGRRNEQHRQQQGHGQEQCSKSLHDDYLPQGLLSYIRTVRRAFLLSGRLFLSFV